jgi:hypothetical protein
MNHEFEDDLNDDLLSHYDFAKRYRSGTNVVLLDPDVSDAFPTAESVNEALRMLMTIAQRQKQAVSVE